MNLEVNHLNETVLMPNCVQGGKNPLMQADNVV